MRDNYHLHKGLNIPLSGSAEEFVSPLEPSLYYAVKPTDFPYITPQLHVKEGDDVLCGSPVFVDKKNPALRFTSPVSGQVHAIIRGAKRQLQTILIAPDGEDRAVDFEVAPPEQCSRERIIAILLESGCWPFITQRPYGTIANPKDNPKALFISCFDSSPLAPDYDFVFSEQLEALQMGMAVLQQLCPGKVHLGLSNQTSLHSVFYQLNAHRHTFSGPHPAGTVGVQIHHVCPVGKGQQVWCVDPYGLAVIGNLFISGVFENVRTIALTGSGATRPRYLRCHCGLGFQTLASSISAENTLRYISGNPLTGEDVGEDGYLGFYHHQITFLPEGNFREFLGWAKPFRFKKFSAARTYLSFLFPKLLPDKKFNLTTNRNGDERAFVLTDPYRKVLPMDIYLPFLLKAILAGDIEQMEALGMYEVTPEDVALCEFVCPSKIEIQAIIQQGIDLMRKEMSV